MSQSDLASSVVTLSHVSSLFVVVTSIAAVLIGSCRSMCYRLYSKPALGGCFF